MTHKHKYTHFLKILKYEAKQTNVQNFYFFLQEETEIFVYLWKIHAPILMTIIIFVNMCFMKINGIPLVTKNFSTIS